MLFVVIYINISKNTRVRRNITLKYKIYFILHHILVFVLNIIIVNQSQFSTKASEIYFI